MRKIVMYCDRCKKEFKRWHHIKSESYGIAEFVYDEGDPYLDSPKDLCESCYTELENWWNFIPQTENEIECSSMLQKAISTTFKALEQEPSKKKRGCYDTD